MFEDIFGNKKIIVMGLGLLGRGVGDAIFLAEHNANLVVTDLKKENELAPSLAKLKKYKNITYSLGGHCSRDLSGADMIIKSAGVPLDSPYIAEARKLGIPIEMSASLFAKLSKVKIIGVTGTRGKSTITHLIYHILNRSGRKAFIGGNVRGVSTLALLDNVRPEDAVVLELDSWQLQGFGDSKISPHIAVFSNLMSDHMNYYKGDTQKYFLDKVNIFKHQKKNGILIAGELIAERIKSEFNREAIVVGGKDIPPDWELNIIGSHNRENTALAVAAVSAFGIRMKDIKKAVQSFAGVPGRLELIKKMNGVEFYNDTTATMPEATMAALNALSKNKNIILIMGGADKGLDPEFLLRAVSELCKAVILLSGTGTDKIKNSIQDIVRFEYNNLEEAVNKAYSLSVPRDIILFSPAFASFGLFKNEFDRGDQFLNLIQKIK